MIAIAWLVISTIIENYSNVKEIHTDFSSSFFRKSIVNSIILESKAESNYIQRPELEELVNIPFTYTPFDSYFIIYGNKGSGKTELIAHAAIGRKGVVRIDE